MPTSRSISWSFLGRVRYGDAYALQLEAREAIRKGSGGDRLLLLEHPHVYTLGRNASPSDVLASPAWMATHGVEVVECDRGGQVTYHGPGQLVGYPIFNLSPDRRDIRRYVRDLQTVLVQTLADFGIRGEIREGQEFIGVWAGEEKIASIGVHLSRWITTHGFALNVTTDLALFDGIVACGLDRVRTTSIERLTGMKPSLSQVAAVAAGHVGTIFGHSMVEEAVEVAGEGLR